ncbi:MAG TPA: helix-turn-helix transcriptional regulator [Woeseiaceae bacterium]|nr:helix-turn-helix transcriptional regulator [Woeseiaceae bacterium]
MSRKDTEHSGVMDEDGERVRKRRERIGMGKKELAAEAGVSRDTLAAIEEGRNFRRASLTRIEGALDRLELEMGIDAPPPSTDPAAPSLVTFRLFGENSGLRATVEGPLEGIEEIEAAAERMFRRMQANDDNNE